MHACMGPGEWSHAPVMLYDARSLCKAKGWGQRNSASLKSCCLSNKEITEIKAAYKNGELDS